MFKRQFIDNLQPCEACKGLIGRNHSQKAVKNIVKFQKFNPLDAISPFVAGYWYMDSLPSGDQVSKCFPTGFLDIITVVGGSPGLFLRGEEWMPTPLSMVVGIRTEPVQLKTPGRSSVFGIRLYPETLLQLLRRPVRELVNHTEAVEDVFGRGIADLTERLALAPDNETRVAICNAFFFQLLPQWKPGQHYLTEALRQARQLGATASAEVLSKKVFVGERQIQRAFSENIGITPKLYGRLSRFGLAAQMQLKNPGVSWTRVSHECGYADQAHLIREFKSFTGFNPKAFINDPMAVQMI